MLRGTVRLVAVGDVMVSRAVSAGFVESPLGALIRGADLALANLETPFSDRGYPAEKMITFRSAPGLVSEVGRLGFRVVSVANNHALDYGPEALLQTLELLRCAGIGAVGGGRNRAEAEQPLYVDAGGVRVAVLGLACTAPPGFAAGEARPGIAVVRVRQYIIVDTVASEEQPGMSPFVSTQVDPSDLDRVCRVVGAAREQADLVVVSIHWGVPPGWYAPFQGALAEYQRPLARSLVEAGADLILGHHPHVPHGVERIGSSLVVYSLGNFMFHYLAEPGPLLRGVSFPPYSDEVREAIPGEDESFVLVLDVRRGRPWLAGAELVPVVLDGRGEPLMAPAERAAGIMDQVARMSARLGTEVRVRDGRGFVVV